MSGSGWGDNNGCGVDDDDGGYYYGNKDGRNLKYIVIMYLFLNQFGY